MTMLPTLSIAPECRAAQRQPLLGCPLRWCPRCPLVTAGIWMVGWRKGAPSLAEGVTWHPSLSIWFYPLDMSVSLFRSVLTEVTRDWWRCKLGSGGTWVVHLKSPGLDVWPHSPCSLDRAWDMAVCRMLIAHQPLELTAAAPIEHFHLGCISLYFISAMT